MPYNVDRKVYIMGHTTVRIREETRDALRALADAEGKPMQALLEEAIEALRRLRFLQRVNDAYAALRESPAAWASIENERREWDDSLLDGLSRPAKPRPAKPRTRRAPKARP